jgi:flagellar basal body-associated protein FliL
MTGRKRTSESERGEAPDGTPAPGDSARKGSRLITAAVATVTAAFAAGAGYFLLPAVASQLPLTKDPLRSHRGSHAEAGAQSERPAEKKAPQHKSSEKKAGGKAKNPEAASEDRSSSFEVRGDVAFYVLRPIVVTLRPQGRVRYLRVGLAIETAPDAESAFTDRELAVLDILNGYLRSVSVTAIEDPAAMARIREQIARRIRFVVDDAPVNAVLITDFILS